MHYLRTLNSVEGTVLRWAPPPVSVLWISLMSTTTGSTHVDSLKFLCGPNAWVLAFYYIE